MEAKKLGFTLTEIQELLSLELRAGTTSKDIRDMARLKLDDIEEKIKLLKSMQRTLKGLIQQCSGHGTIEQCPILKSIKKK